MRQIQSKKGMINQMQVIAFGIVALVILVGIGIVVTSKLRDSVGCATGFTYNETDDTCINSSGTTGFAKTAAGTGLSYGITQLGTTGLLSWLPAVIALLVGVFFLSYFANKNQGKEY